MSANTLAGPPPGSYRALALATLAFALCFSVWGLVAPLAPWFQELYDLSSFQISVVIATPVILGDSPPPAPGVPDDADGLVRPAALAGDGLRRGRRL
jgi:hypothetical protein